MTRRSRRRLSAQCAIALLALLATACHDSTSGSGFPGTTAPAPGGGTAAAPGSSGPITPPPNVVVSSPPPLPDGAVAHPPTAIAANCSTDVTDSLEAWIESVADNSTLQLAPHACYRLDGTLVLDHRNRLLVDGNGATLEANGTGNRNRGQLSLKGGSDLTVRDLIVRGANPHAGATAAAYVPDLEAQHGFSVHGATNVLLDHVQAYDTYGDFVYIGPDGSTPSRNVTVANSVFERSGRQGISLTDANGVTITANAIAGVARSLIDIEPILGREIVRNIHIDGNTTGAAVNFWLANKGAPADIGNIVVSGNRMAAATGGLVFVFARKGPARGPFTFDGNQMIANDAVTDEGSTGAFYFARVDNVTLHDNTVRFPAGRSMPAVELHDVHGADLSGNRFDGAARAVVADSQSADIKS